jgi:hypothetical protein
MVTFRFRRSGAAALLLVVGVLLVGACGGAGDESRDSSATDDATEQGAADPGSGGGEAADDAVTSGEGESAAPGSAVPDVDLEAQAAQADRQVISTATLTVEVDDLDEAGDAAVDLADAAGGYVFGEQTDRGSAATSTLELKVPPAEFEATLDALGELGDLRTQNIQTDDVTEAVVDLESRITTAEASVDRLRALTDEAGSVPDLTALESELLARETTLEQLRGELRTLEDQVALATVTVTFSTEDGAPVVEEDDDDLPTFLGGLEAGWDVLVTIVAAGLAVLGFLVPFLVPALVVAAVVLLVVRRTQRRARREAGAPGPSPDATTAPDEPAP